MEKSCFNCKHYDQPSFKINEFCLECLRQEEVYAKWECKPITNADLIRAMADEELAKQIVEWNQGDCPTIGDCPETQNSFECEPWRCWLSWLRQEAEDPKIEVSDNNVILKIEEK